MIVPYPFFLTQWIKSSLELDFIHLQAKGIDTLPTPPHNKR
jgi:hypothetical protein